MDNKETIRTFDSQTKYDDGGFLDYYKSIPSYKNDTSSYNLRRAYELAPKEELEAFAKSDAHLRSVYMNPKTGVYEFMKSKDHPTLKYELDWYNSDDPEAIKFRNDYSLDTTGNYYKYVPKKEEGGLLDKAFKKAPDDGKWARDPKKDSNLENVLEYAPGLGNVLSVNDALTSYQKLYNNPSLDNLKNAGLETLGLIPFGSVTKGLASGLSKKFVRKAKTTGYFIDTSINALSDENLDEKKTTRRLYKNF